MRATLIISAFTFLLPALAYTHGDIGTNVAVRSDGDGIIHHFYEKDRIEHEKREAEAQIEDPQLDRYPVKTDEQGNIVPFSQ